MAAVTDESSRGTMDQVVRSSISTSKAEDQGCNGGLENSGNGAGCSATHQQHHRFVVEPQEVPDIGANGGAGKDNGGLKSHRSAQSHGQRRGHHGAPGIVWFQVPFSFGDGEEDLADAVPDVLFQQVLHKEHGEHDAQQGEQEDGIGRVIAQEHDLGAVLHEVGEVLQQNGGSARQQANDHAQAPASFAGA